MGLRLLFSVYIALVGAPASFEIEASQNVWDVAAEDMNCDHFNDILVLHNDEKTFPLNKEIALHLAGDDGSYRNIPDHRLKLPEKTGAVFLAEVDGMLPREIVTIHGAGADVFQFTRDGFNLVATVEFPSLFPSYSREPRFVSVGAQDLTDDGIEEWLIPTARGLQVRTLDREIAVVLCDVVSEIRSGDNLYITHRLPDLQTFKLEDQQTLGLAFLSDEFADFAFGENWSQRERFQIPMNLDEKWDASAVMKDITGSGFPDLVVTQTRGTARLYAETQVYLARNPFSYPNTPDAVFSAEGAVSSPLLLDVNGDKLLDLVFIRIPFGVKNFVNFFVRGKISVRAEVHLYDGNTFRSKANFTTDMTMDAPEGRSRVAYTFGDFNGDGLIDVAYGVAKNVFAVYTGEPQRFIAPRPWQRFSVPSFGQARAYDLNNNQAKDIILFRPGSDKAKRIDVFVF